MPNDLPALTTGMTAEQAIARAREASAARVWNDAADRWADVRLRFPDEAAGYSEGAKAQDALGAYQASDAILAEGIRRLPDHRDIYVEYAHNAGRRQDWMEAAVRWQAIRQSFPDFWLGYAAGGAALRQSGQLRDAGTLVAQGLARFTDASELLFEHARLAEAEGNWDEAAARWRRVCDEMPEHWIGYLSGAYSLRRAERFADAAFLLEAGQKNLPDDRRVFTEYARLAEAQQDWPLAARRWAHVRRHFPDLVDAYTGGADAWLQAGDPQAAETVLTEGLLRVPNEQGLWIRAAHAADRRQDADDGIFLWIEVTNRFPHLPDGWLARAKALRERGMLDDAEAVLGEASTRHPDDHRLVTERAVIAHRRHDMPAAVERWQHVLRRMPDHEMAYLMLADALRSMGRRDEAERYLTHAIARFPDRPEPSLAYARMAEGDTDSSLQLRRWQDALKRFPDRLDCYLSVAAALKKNRETEAAEAVLADAATRFPDAPQPLSELGASAMHRSAFDLAATTFARLRERFPDRTDGYFGGAQTEMNRGRMADATTMIDEAVARFPDDAGMSLMRVHVLLHPYAIPKDPDEAIRRTDQTLARFPDNLRVALFSLQVRRDNGRLQEAWTLSETLCARSPDDLELAIERARIAAALADWPNAIALFTAVASRAPQRSDIAVRLCETLLLAGQLDEAEDMSRQAMASHPDDPAAFLQFGTIAARRADWPEALKRWDEGARRFPHTRDFQARMFEANLRLAEAETKPGSTPTPEAADQPEAPPERTLMLQFESLGGSGHGCEFGLAQRHYGAEPLDLLRWSDLGDGCDGLIHTNRPYQ